MPQGMTALCGVAMELEDCAFPLLHDVVLTDDPAIGFRATNYALLVGAKPRGKDMEGRDLISENAQIFARQARAIDHLAPTNQHRGAATINAQGASSAASAADAAIDHMQKTG